MCRRFILWSSLYYDIYSQGKLNLFLNNCAPYILHV